jgi:hypothetical protein
VRGRPGPGLVTAAIAIAGAATLLGAAVTAGPAFVSSAGTALLAAELDTVGDGEITLLGVNAGAVPDPDTYVAIDGLLRSELADQDLPAPTAQVLLELDTTGEPSSPLLLLGREGASDHLPPTVDDAPGPFAIPASSAARVGGVGAGDVVEVRGLGGTTTDLQLGPIVEDLDRGDVPPFWRPVSGLLTAVDDPRIPPPPPAALAEPAAVLDVLGQVVDTTGGSSSPVRASWTVPLEGELTLEQAQGLLPRVTTLRTAVVDPTTELGELLAAGGTPGSVSGQQVDAALQRVERATAGLTVPVRALGWAGQALALLGVALAALLGGRRRLSRARLWAARGVAAPVVGLRWAAFAVVPVVLGCVLGAVLAWVGTEALGPGGGVDGSVRTQVLLPMLGAAALAVLTVGVVVTVRAAAATREQTPGRLPPVLEAALLVLAGLALWQLDTRGGAVTVDVEGTLRLDALTVAAPLVLVVAVAAVGTRVVGLVCRHGLGRRGGRGVGYLTDRRLRSVGGTTLTLVALVATTVGTFVVAWTLGASAEATIEEQAGVLVGADAVLPLSRAEAVSGGLDTEELGLPATRVRRAPEALLDGRHTVDVLLVDPATFGEVAYRPRRLAAVDVDGLLDDLTPAGEGVRPTVVVGGDRPLRGVHELSLGGVDLEVVPVGTAPVFPGATGQRTTLVVADGGPLTPDDAATASRLAVAVYPELWIDGGELGPEAIRTHLEQVVLPGPGSGPGATGQREFGFADEVRRDPGLAPARWTFAFLQAQALTLSLIAVAGLLLHHRGRQRDRALATALTRRMGLPPRATSASAALELSVLLGTAVALGAAGGVAGAGLALREYAPLPDVSLPVAFVPPVPLLAVLVTVGATLVVVTTVAGRRAADRADVAVLLRGGA